MTFRVDIPLRVVNQILDSALYIADDSVERASAWTDRVMQRIAELDTMPEGYPIAEEETKRKRTTIRKLLLGNYRVLFRVDRDRRVVYVLDFRHAARSEME